MKVQGTKALEGALRRAEGRSSNGLSAEAHRAMQADPGWNNWPDWGDESDFPNWENIGGNPPK